MSDTLTMTSHYDRGTEDSPDEIELVVEFHPGSYRASSRLSPEEVVAPEIVSIKNLDGKELIETFTDDEISGFVEDAMEHQAALAEPPE